MLRLKRHLHYVMFRLRRRAPYSYILLATLTVALYLYFGGRPTFKLNPELALGLGEQHDKACIQPRLQMQGVTASSAAQLDCAKHGVDWTRISDNGTLVMTRDDITCHYTSLRLGNDDFDLQYGKTHDVPKSGLSITDDFLEVTCRATDGSRYENLHMAIAPRDAVSSRPVKTDTLRTRMLGRIPASEVRGGQQTSGLNIIMFGFDSVSRVMWEHNLPKLHDYLVNSLGAVVLKGYNIIGDGTPQALLPILTGLNEVELPEARRGHAGATYVNNHPWIWHKLHQLGYATLHAEDSSQYGSFTFRMRGFKHAPTDHYARAFYTRMESVLRRHRRLCFGARSRHIVLLDWLRQFHRVYAAKPRFSFAFHSEYSHDSYSNALRLADDEQSAFVRDLHASGSLDNSLLVYFSDHGARFSTVRRSLQGRYEERMPYMSLRFPPWFVQRYPHAIQALRDNADRLTTPYDIHATFADLLSERDDELPSNDELWRRARGISLLRPVPLKRTCDDASIDAHYCTCLHWAAMNVTNTTVKAAARHLVDTINDITAFKRAICQPLALHSITSALTFVPNSALVRYSGSVDFDGRVAGFHDSVHITDSLYQISVVTRPGMAEFEATVTRDANGQFVVKAERISRVNKYGSQPHCVATKFPYLRNFCYCTLQP